MKRLVDYMTPKVTTDGSRPVPVRYCRDKRTGELVDIKTLNLRQLLEKVYEELMEASLAVGAYLEAPDDPNDYYRQEIGRECTDTIFSLATLLENAGYDEAERDELNRVTYEKNKARGYYGER